MQEYVVGENQQKKYCFLIDKTNALHDAHIRFYVERNAILVVEILIVHVSVNLIIDCILQGEGADARIFGAYILHALDNVTITTMQHHIPAHTHSNLIMKGILRENAYVHYHGTIRVEKEAHGTHASQENKNMLLSDSARAVSVPSLEVLSHDVRCFHGSAIGRFDKEQLFYAAARGIDGRTAQQLLLRAFLADLFGDELLNERLSSLIG